MCYTTRIRRVETKTVYTRRDQTWESTRAAAWIGAAILGGDVK